MFVSNGQYGCGFVLSILGRNFRPADDRRERAPGIQHQTIDRLQFVPRQLVFIEEPEKGLYHQYLKLLADEMIKSVGTGFSKQLFVTTHSPFFVNALNPENVWVLTKGEDGFSTVRRASEYEFVKELSEEGVPLGDMWYSKYFG